MLACWGCNREVIARKGVDGWITIVSCKTMKSHLTGTDMVVSRGSDMSTTNETAHCRCGNTVIYANPSQGCVNVGHFQSTTGWFYVSNTFTGGATWMCPGCHAKLIEHALAINELVGHSHVHLISILSQAETV